MGMYGVEGLGVNFSENVGSEVGQGVADASNALHVVDSNTATVAAADAATGGVTTVGKILLGVFCSILGIAIIAVILLGFKSYSVQLNNGKNYFRVFYRKNKPDEETVEKNNLGDDTLSDSSTLNPQADLSEKKSTFVSSSVSNAQQFEIPTKILLSSKTEDQNLVKKITNMLLKIKNGTPLEQEDAYDIDTSKINSNTIKLSSEFDLLGIDDLAKATKKLVEELQKVHFDRSRVDEATKTLKKKASI